MIRRFAVDAETWMNIQRKGNVLAQSAAPQSSCFDIIFTGDLQERSFKN